MNPPVQQAAAAPAAAKDYGSACPVCDGTALRTVYRFPNFEVLSCGSCSASWRYPMYTPEDIVEMYAGEAYEEHPFFSYDSSDAAALESVPRFKRLQYSLEVLEGHVEVGRLLDVGAGAGTFMAMAQTRGWDVHGVELCEPLCDEAEKLVGPARVTNTKFEDIEVPDEPYDAVTMWDVIEHVLDPLAWIEKTRSLLRPGGILVICTPDEESLLARTGHALYRYSGGRYSYPALALHPRYHTFFFSGTSLKALFERGGMELVQSHSQEAFAAHSPLANRAQKLAIGGVERLAAPRGTCYERVAFARA